MIKHPIEEAILKTLTYRDLFDYPLTAGEVHRFLIRQSSSKERVKKTLGEMASEGKVQEKGGFFFLPGREELVALRAKREGISQAKFEKAVNYAKLLHLIPWVRGVFVTGTLAMGNAEEEGDLDLLVIARERRIWLTRLMTTFLLDLLGIRIKIPHKVKDRVDPNMFLSESALLVPSNEQNLYTAHEVVQAVPIWEVAPIHQEFLAMNRWVREFFPNLKPPSRPDDCSPKRGITFLDWLESFVYKLQRRYMERKRTREVVTPERILFHPTNRAEEILSNLETRFNALHSSET
jgi:hypothetical protein